MPWLFLAARWIAGSVLAAAGFLKLLSPPEELALVMESYRLLPVSVLMPLARVLPWTELFAGVYLFLGYAQRVSALAAMALFSGFVGALVSVQARGIDLAECGCFGRAGPHFTPWQALFFDAVILVLAAAALRDPYKRWSLDRWLAKSR
jgi:uncharacterized membrane protein YphA (DoxX/SURF4 family)